jgi:phosphoribosylformylglycinamidine synthase I
MRVAVIEFPGSNCDRDTVHVLKEQLQIDTDLVWHRNFSADSYDAVILPGGFSFGDHLRAGIIAAHSPATQAIIRMADEGKPVLGICNGFQILIEAGLLPGALLRNASLKFVCKWMNLKVEADRTAFTCAFKTDTKIRMPIAHNEGRYFADNELLDDLTAAGRVVMRYHGENPTGTARGIAGVSNERGNVVGMMPHPERASDSALGGTDGLGVFESMVEWVKC